MANSAFSVGGSSGDTGASAKAWIRFNGTTPAILDSFNVTSLTDNSTGNYNVNFTIDFADTNYAQVVSAEPMSGLQYGLIGGINTDLSKTVSSSQIVTGYVSSVAAGAAVLDNNNVNAVYFGEQ